MRIKSLQTIISLSPEESQQIQNIPGVDFITGYASVGDIVIYSEVGKRLTSIYSPGNVEVRIPVVGENSLTIKNVGLDVTDIFLSFEREV